MVFFAIAMNIYRGRLLDSKSTPPYPIPLALSNRDFPFSHHFDILQPVSPHQLQHGRGRTGHRPEPRPKLSGAV